MNRFWKSCLGLALGALLVTHAEAASAAKATTSTTESAQGAPAIAPEHGPVRKGDAKAAQRWLEQQYQGLERDVKFIADSFDEDIENDVVNVETQLFHVERLAVDLILAAESAGFATDMDRMLFQNKVRTKLRSISRLREQTQKVTMDLLDKYLPGEPGARRIFDAATGMTEYQPLMRSATPTPGQKEPAASVVLHEFLKAFLAAGNKFSDIKPLRRSTLAKLGDQSDFIWAQESERVPNKRGGTRIKLNTWIAPDRKGIKHPIVAMGPKLAKEYYERVESGELDPESEEAQAYVKAATGGTVQFWRAPTRDHWALVPVTNKTGNYKAGEAAILGMQPLLERAEVGGDAIIEHTAEVGRPEILKLLLKAQVASGKWTKAKADAYLERHKELAQPVLAPPILRIRAQQVREADARDAALKQARSDARAGRVGQVVRGQARPTRSTAPTKPTRAGGGR